jgi:hypothetical protein
LQVRMFRVRRRGSGIMGLSVAFYFFLLQFSSSLS